MSLGGKPRSLELEEDLGETRSGSRDAKSALKSINAVDSSTVNFNIVFLVNDGPSIIHYICIQYLMFDINLPKHHRFQIKILRQNFPSGVFCLRGHNKPRKLIQEMMDL